uniref:Survival of motor neuron-related-splicing factor 30-like n=1 Tax=Phallusia mammillata TaxID=59560 RepID=A0A6F9DTR1_9ASCI|nr:survival of motor neuron-related-splicing factor 30-like [Phallusia mammillata]
MPPVKVEELSIYQGCNCSNSSQMMQTNSSMHSSMNIGNSTVRLVSEVHEKYRKTLKLFTDFKEYTTTTEGKIKLSIMSAGLLAGGVLGVRSSSNRIWYKRMLPVGTLACAASICYPWKAYEVSKTITITSYHISIAVGRQTKKMFQSISSAYEKYAKQTKQTDTTKSKEEEEEKETVYQVGEGGIVQVETPANEESTKPQNTVLHLLPDTITQQVTDSKSLKSNIIDPGQSSTEDTDLYTTRS